MMERQLDQRESHMTQRSAADLVAEAKAKVENLTVDQVAGELDAGDTVFVDLREPEELAASGKIPGAVHVPRGMIEFRADPTSPYHNDALDPSKRTVLYCASGGRSALAAATLKDLGYANVAHLDGGFKTWAEAGKPVESGS